MSTEEVTPQQELANGFEQLHIQPQETEKPVANGNAETTPTSTIQKEDQNGQHSDAPEITPALATEGGREVSRKILYVGGLVKTLTEEDLRGIFSTSGSVQSVKVLFDKNRPGFNYAFVEFDDEESARASFESLNGKSINGAELRINWAYQSQQAKSNPDAFNVFVGDLSAEINDEKLRNAFSQFSSLLQAHVMWDMQSGRSRGYGFVSFEDQKDADEAIKTMSGHVLSGRAIRLNWASHKQQTHSNGHGHHGHHHHHHHNGNGLHNGGMNQGHYYKYSNNHHHNNNFHHHNNANYTNGTFQQNNILTNGLPTTNGTAPGTPMGSTLQLNGAPMNGTSNLSMIPQPNFDAVMRKAPTWQTTVYVGNLAHYTTQNDLIPLLQPFGFIVDLKSYPEKGCAFVKYDAHDRAAMAICNLSGLILNGRALKLGWGRERQPNNVGYQNYGPMVYQQ